MANKSRQVSTKRRQALFITKYAKCSNITKACQEAGIDRQTYYNWMEQPEFKKKFDDAINVWGDVVEEGLRYYADKRNPDILKFMAKHKFKDRGYTDKREVEMKGSLSIGKLSDSESDELLELLKEE